MILSPAQPLVSPSAENITSGRNADVKDRPSRTFARYSRPGTAQLPWFVGSSVAALHPAAAAARRRSLRSVIQSPPPAHPSQLLGLLVPACAVEAGPLLVSLASLHPSHLNPRMERPPQPRSLGPPTPVLSVSTTPTPNSAAASTIYVSPAAVAAAAPSNHHQLRHPHGLLLQSDAAGAALRRGPKRAARGEMGAPEESPVLWGSGSPAKPDGAGRSGHPSSPGLGTSPDDDDDRDSSTASPAATSDQPRKKQKRNKPTLSCFECVERKTKVRFIQLELFTFFNSRRGPLDLHRATPPS